MVGAFPFKNFLDDFYEHFVLVDKGNGKKKILIFEIAAEPKRHEERKFKCIWLFNNGCTIAGGISRLGL